MLDRFSRRINYLRISVTDRCNLRCVYCMPPAGVPLKTHADMLAFEEIREVVCVATEMGIDKVRLTGGEPLARRGIVALVGMLAAVPGINDYAMTTNGILLATFAEPLAAAGLRRVNVSLDAVDPARYAETTRGGDVSRVFAGIAAARQAGLSPIKLNCVVKESPSEPDARDVAAYAEEEGLPVRYIRQMRFSTGEFWPVTGGTGGVCRVCNRLRLTSDGMIKPCLFSDLSFSVRELGVREAIRQAVAAKPEVGTASQANSFYRIGG